MLSILSSQTPRPNTTVPIPVPLSLWTYVLKSGSYFDWLVCLRPPFTHLFTSFSTICINVSKNPVRMNGRSYFYPETHHGRWFSYFSPFPILVLIETKRLEAERPLWPFPRSSRFVLVQIVSAMFTFLGNKSLNALEAFFVADKQDWLGRKEEPWLKSLLY